MDPPRPVHRQADITPEIANEALADPDALVQDPDPASKSGISIRTTGYSTAFGALITVITVEEDGTVWGVNAWPSNDSDSRKYERQE